MNRGRAHQGTGHLRILKILPQFKLTTDNKGAIEPGQMLPRNETPQDLPIGAVHSMKSDPDPLLTFSASIRWFYICTDHQI